MKGIFYNTNDGNVKIDLWLDKNANNDWGDGPVLFSKGFIRSIKHFELLS